MIKDIGFIIYAVSDMKVSRPFYENILGLKSNGEFDTPENPNPSWIEYSVGASTFAIGCAPDQWKPSSDGAVVAFDVVDFDAMIATLKSNYVEFKLEAQEYPTCKMAVIFDPDKNPIMIHQLKPKGGE